MFYKIAKSSILNPEVESFNESKKINNCNTKIAKINIGNEEYTFIKKEGCLYVLVRACGVGVNANGDAFEYEELKKAYKTFENKNVFLNHQSKDVTMVRGRILSSFFIDKKDDSYVLCLLEMDEKSYPELCRGIRMGHLTDVSMGALQGDSKVTLENGSFKFVKDLNVGDKILTDDTSIGIITAIGKTNEHKTKYKIYSRYFGGIVLSKEHPLLTAEIKNENYKIGWKNASDITEKDFLLSPIYNKIGSFESYSFLTYEIIENLSKEIKNKKLCLSGKNIKIENKGENIFDGFFLDKDVLNWPKIFKIYLIVNLFKKIGTLYVFNSKNDKITHQLKTILESLNILPNYKSYDGFNYLSISASYLPILEDFNIDYKVKYKDDYFIKNNFIFDKVISCSVLNNEDELYHITVNGGIQKGNHSYIANGIANHNCIVEYSLCSVCNNKAKNLSEYCDHIRRFKSGYTDNKHVYEINKGVDFIELSFVSSGADHLAKVENIIAEHQVQEGIIIQNTTDIPGVENNLSEVEKLENNKIKEDNDLKKIHDVLNNLKNKVSDENLVLVKDVVDKLLNKFLIDEEK